MLTYSFRRNCGVSFASARLDDDLKLLVARSWSPLSKIVFKNRFVQIFFFLLSRLILQPHFQTFLLGRQKVVQGFQSGISFSFDLTPDQTTLASLGPSQLAYFIRKNMIHNLNSEKKERGCLLSF